MTMAFWVIRALLVLGTSFLLILMAQWLKSQNFSYAIVQATLWAPLTTLLYLAVLWRKLRNNKNCAIKYQKADPAE